MVKCIGKEGNKVKLSRKAILAQEKAAAGGAGGAGGGEGESRDRGGDRNGHGEEN